MMVYSGNFLFWKMKFSKYHFRPRARFKKSAVTRRRCRGSALARTKRNLKLATTTSEHGQQQTSRACQTVGQSQSKRQRRYLRIAYSRTSQSFTVIAEPVPTTLLTKSNDRGTCLERAIAATKSAMRSERTTSKNNPKRKRNRAAISITAILLQSQVCLCTATTVEQYSNLPQHRIRTTKRIIQYGPDHPWQRSNDMKSGSIFERDDLIRDGGAEQEEVEGQDAANHFRRLDGGSVIEEFLPKSNITMWSTMSNTMAVVDVDVDADTSVDPESIPTSNPSSATKPSTKVFQNIRIRASLLSHESSGAPSLSKTQRSTILEQIIHPALKNWSLALSITPIQDMLEPLKIDKYQLYDDISCGPGVFSGFPSVVVPIDHIEDGIGETDLMIYVSVGFRGNLLKELEAEADGDGEERRRQLLRGGVAEPVVFSSVAAVDAGSTAAVDAGANGDAVDTGANGDAGATGDAEETVTVDEASVPMKKKIPSCSGNYLASSTYCSTDQFDRPIAGLLHLCIGDDFFKKSSLEMNQVTIMHELGHILGFNSQSMAHFRRKNGDPITLRDENGDVFDELVNCTGVAEGRQARIPLPSPDILQFTEVRGVRVAQIVTPAVQQIARNHFDCQDLEGAELESYSYRGDANSTGFVDHCISDHWERRLFKSDIMNPIVDSVSSLSHISPLTLAYFMDSGWYKVDISRAAEPDIWGRAAGCDFVNKQCISDEGEVSLTNSQFFCSSSLIGKIDGCADDMMGKASCSVVEYSDELATEYQYFDNPLIGGQDADLDFCPSFDTSRERDLCDSADSKGKMEEFGETARCLSGRIGSNAKAALCVHVACIIEEKKMYVRVDGEWKACNAGEFIVGFFDSDDYGKCIELSRKCVLLQRIKNLILSFALQSSAQIHYGCVLLSTAQETVSLMNLLRSAITQVTAVSVRLPVLSGSNLFHAMIQSDLILWKVRANLRSIYQTRQI